MYSNGQKFIREIPHKAKERLDVYRRLGKAKLVEQSEVREMSQTLDQKRLRSNDSHIIALALAAKVSLVRTEDQALMDDFRDPKIMGKGNKGSIYRRARNKNLLTRDRCP